MVGGRKGAVLPSMAAAGGRRSQQPVGLAVRRGSGAKPGVSVIAHARTPGVEPAYLEPDWRHGFWWFSGVAMLPRRSFD